MSTLRVYTTQINNHAHALAYTPPVFNPPITLENTDGSCLT